MDGISAAYISTSVVDQSVWVYSKNGTDLTGPNSSNFALVSVVSGVDARIQTPPLLSLIAVDLPPNGIKLKREKGLRISQSLRYGDKFENAGLENVQMSFVT